MPRRSPVHPRTCGEHKIGAAMTGDKAGSSPHVRGTLFEDLHGQARIRFIPARAGNTFCAGLPYKVSTVHPRTCGEHAACRCRDPRARGSSPHVRGTLVWDSQMFCPFRFIPARAGNTVHPPAQMCASPVHPRTCGDHHVILKGRGLPVGSSPLVRGTRWPLLREAKPSRFTPARAGNTSNTKNTRSMRPVHPRTCGEH